LSSEAALYTVYWTEDILAGLPYQLRRGYPDWDGGKITEIRNRTADTFEGGRVDDFVIDGSFQGTDPNNQHVHAAALASRADIILTDDQRFVGPGCDPDQHPYEVYTPGAFFILADDSAWALSGQ